MTATAEVTIHRAAEELEEGDASRAAIYGLLSVLFSAAPTAQLLDTIAQAGGVIDDDAQSGLAVAWRELREAARAACPSAARDEYDAAFIGTGRSPVSLDGLSWIEGGQREQRLVALRDELARMGLGRREDCGYTEYHVAALCDVMRHLLTDAGRDDADRFFGEHVAPWYPRCFAAMADSAQTAFYKHVARFAREYFDIESQLIELA